jgi:hypothetical protein
VFDAVMSCDRDRQRLMKLVELEVEERLKLRRKSEIEEAEKLAQKDGRLSRPERISTPVEPDSTVSADSVNDKPTSDTEIESESNIAQHVDSSRDHGEVSDSSMNRLPEPHGRRIRKRKHSGETCLTREEGGTVGKTGRADNRCEYGSIAAAHNFATSAEAGVGTQSGTQGVIPRSVVGVSAVSTNTVSSAAKSDTGSQGIKYRPWMEFETRNPAELQKTNVRTYHEGEARQTYSWQNYSSGNSDNSRLQAENEKVAKRHKNRPEPIVIPQNSDKGLHGTSSVSYPSWLRSPCLRGNSSVLPYTPPPMLSPTRNGAGLFWTMNQVVHQPAAKIAGPNTSSPPGWLTVHYCLVVILQIV